MILSHMLTLTSQVLSSVYFLINASGNFLVAIPEQLRRIHLTLRCNPRCTDLGLVLKLLL